MQLRATDNDELDGPRAVQIRVRDLLSSANAVLTVQLVDNEVPPAPDLTLAITRSGSGSPTTAETITFTFSSAVTGFSADDIQVTGGALSNFATSGSNGAVPAGPASRKTSRKTNSPTSNFAASGSNGAVYTATFTPSSGNARILVRAGVAEAAGFGNPSAQLVLSGAQGNQAPTLSSIRPQPVLSPGNKLTVPVFARDPDRGDTLQYKASSSNSDVVTVTPTTLTNHDANSKVTVTAMGDGTSVITLVVSDGTVDTVRSFTVVVNQAPVVTAIDDLTLKLGQGQAIVDVDATAASSDTLTYRAVSSDTRVAMVTPTASTPHSAASQVRVTPLKDGSATITVTVSDGMAEATQTFMVQVQESAPPHLTISRAATEPIIGPFAVSFRWSRAVTGFTASDITVTGGWLSGLTGSGDSYTAPSTAWQTTR